MGMELTAITAMPTVKTSTRRVIWKCPCGAKAYDYTATRTYLGTDKWGAKKWSEARLTREVDGKARDISWDATCPTCKRHRKSAEVRGSVTDHKCNAKCLASTSGICECSCGGANHGKSHL